MIQDDISSTDARESDPAANNDAMARQQRALAEKQLKKYLEEQRQTRRGVQQLDHDFKVKEDREQKAEAQTSHRKAHPPAVPSVAYERAQRIKSDYERRMTGAQEPADVGQPKNPKPVDRKVDVQIQARVDSVSKNADEVTAGDREFIERAMNRLVEGDGSSDVRRLEEQVDALTKDKVGIGEHPEPDVDRYKSEDECLQSGGGPIHFEVEKYDDTNVTMRGGQLNLFTHAGLYQLALRIDAGTDSADLTTMYTMSTAAFTSRTVYAIITKCSALNPVTAPTLVASLSSTAPSPLGRLSRQIAHFTVDGSHKITGSIVQDWTGGNIDEFWLEPDGVSIDYNAAGTPSYKLEINGWKDVALTTPWPASGEIVGRPTAHGGPFYSTVTDLLSHPQTLPGGWREIDLTGASWTSGPFPWTTTHVGLTDVAGGSAGDDHDGSLSTGNFPYVSGRAVYDRDGNAFLEGGGLADADYDLSIDPDARNLSDGARPVLYWGPGGHCLFGDWTQYEPTGHFLMVGNEAITPGTAASGALRVAGGASLQGGLQAASLYVLGDASNNYWTAAAARIKCTGDVELRGETVTMSYGPGGSSYLMVSDDSIDIYPSAGGELMVFGQAVTLIDCQLDINGTPTPAKVLACLV